MNGPEAQKLRLGQARDHAEHARLLGDAQAGLKAHEVPHATAAIFHA